MTITLLRSGDTPKTPRTTSRKNNTRKKLNRLKTKPKKGKVSLQEYVKQLAIFLHLNYNF